MILITMSSVPAKKSLGQNWLVNPGVLDRIVEAAAISANDTVLEIGPGTGALTERLVATGARIIAVEKDARLIESLRKRFPNITVIEGDVLRSDPSDWRLATGNWKLVANIPYYLTSHLIRVLLEEWPLPSLAVLMVQAEVARRIMAVPPDMNLLALAVQLAAKPSIVMRVSRGSFRPVPDVDSAVIKIEPLDTDLEVNRHILALARRAFGQKRKQLAGNIPREALLEAGIPPTARPQELSVDDWRKLADVVR